MAVSAMHSREDMGETPMPRREEVMVGRIEIIPELVELGGHKRVKMTIIPHTSTQMA